MAAMIDELLAAIRWNGCDFYLVLFAAFPSGRAVELRHPVGSSRPTSVREYDLGPDGPIGLRHGWTWTEYDLYFRDVPPDLENVARDWLGAALDNGAEFAWFGFEGAPTLDDLLRHSDAVQVWGIGAGKRVELALDDVYRRSDSWAKVVGEFGANLG
jgi:hypothetical protein